MFIADSGDIKELENSFFFSFFLVLISRSFERKLYLALSAVLTMMLAFLVTVSLYASLHPYLSKGKLTC